jgi:hypothetical protein
VEGPVIEIAACGEVVDAGEEYRTLRIEQVFLSIGV